MTSALTIDKSRAEIGLGRQDQGARKVRRRKRRSGGEGTTVSGGETGERGKEDIRPHGEARAAPAANNANPPNTRAHRRAPATKPRVPPAPTSSLGDPARRIGNGHAELALADRRRQPGGGQPAGAPREDLVARRRDVRVAPRPEAPGELYGLCDADPRPRLYLDELSLAVSAGPNTRTGPRRERASVQTPARPPAPASACRGPSRARARRAPARPAPPPSAHGAPGTHDLDTGTRSQAHGSRGRPPRPPRGSQTAFSSAWMP